MRSLAMRVGLLCAVLFGISRVSLGATPGGEPVIDPPTLHCLGVYWIIHDTDSAPAKVAVEYRKTGDAQWQQGFDLLRVRKVPAAPFLNEGGKPKPPVLEIPADARLFAGSVLRLEPDTEYELRLTLHGPDGPDVVKNIKTRTLAEPIAPADEVVRYVAPGDSGGSGTKADPFKGLAAAESAARPGDLFLVHAGVYTGTFTVSHSGEPGHPIIWRGAGEGEAVIDAKRDEAHLDGTAISAQDVHDVWFEHLSACDAYSGVLANGSSGIVVRRCHIHDVLQGVLAARFKPKAASGLFISDNLMEGKMPWPVTSKQYSALPESRGVWICGAGHVVCFNRIRHFKDGMDLDESQATVSCDFHNNEVSDDFDDGSEMDGSDRNTRNYWNRYTNGLTGVSLQPIHGGPCYVFENVIYNTRGETYKLHNSPSGVFLFQNTAVRKGPASMVLTSAAIYDIVMRNNLFIGTSGRLIEYEPKIENCDFDYDGYAGFSDSVFVKWNNIKYSKAEFRKNPPIEKHMVMVDPSDLFASGLEPPATDTTVYDCSTIDVRLKASSAAVGAGESIPGLSSPNKGRPDLGAYQLGEPLRQYGPRPER